MAFTEVEIKEAHAALRDGFKAEDLFRLGLMYATENDGRGANYVEAHKWFNLAAMMGSQPAKAYRAEITSEMSDAEVSHALKNARAWLSKNRTRMAA